MKNRAWPSEESFAHDHKTRQDILDFIITNGPCKTSDIVLCLPIGRDSVRRTINFLRSARKIKLTKNGYKSVI